MYLLVYDIVGKKRLKKISQILQRYGRRVQKSVFECDVVKSRYDELRGHLIRERGEGDKIFVYHVGSCAKCEKI